MEDKKKIVALSDEALDNVAGGLVINYDHVIDQDTGIRYDLLNGDMWGAYQLVVQLGAYATDAERIDALRAAGYIA